MYSIGETGEGDGVARGGVQAGVLARSFSPSIGRKGFVNLEARGGVQTDGVLRQRDGDFVLEVLHVYNDGVFCRAIVV